VPGYKLARNTWHIKRVENWFGDTGP